MISNRSIRYSSKRSEPLHEHVLAPFAGIDETKSFTDNTHVYKMENLDVNSDGSVSLRKPLIYMDSWDVNITYNNVEYSLKCKKVIPTYIPNVKIIIFEREGYKSEDTVPKFWIAVTDNSTKYKINVTYSDVDYKEHTILSEANDYCVGSDLYSYYGIPVEGGYHFIDFSDLKAFNTPTTTIFGNCTVDLTSSLFNDDEGVSITYYPKIMLESDASKAARYIQFTRSLDDSDVFVLAIKSPELNTIDPGASLPLNPNMALDNPYAIRDAYGSSYTDILGIQAYASPNTHLENVTRSDSFTSDIKYDGFYSLQFKSTLLSGEEYYKSNNKTILKHDLAQTLYATGVKAHAVDVSLEVPYNVYATLYNPTDKTYRTLSGMNNSVTFTDVQSDVGRIYSQIKYSYGLEVLSYLDINLESPNAGDNSNAFQSGTFTETDFKNNLRNKAKYMAYYGLKNSEFFDILKRGDSININMGGSKASEEYPEVSFNVSSYNSAGLLCVSQTLYNPSWIDFGDALGNSNYPLCHIVVIISAPKYSHNVILEVPTFSEKLYILSTNFKTDPPISEIYDINTSDPLQVVLRKNNYFYEYMRYGRAHIEDITDKDGAVYSISDGENIVSVGVPISNTISYSNYSVISKYASTNTVQYSIKDKDSDAVNVFEEVCKYSIVSDSSTRLQTQLEINIGNFTSNDNVDPYAIQVNFKNDTRTYNVSDYTDVNNPKSIILTHKFTTRLEQGVLKLNYILQSYHNAALLKIYEISESTLSNSFKILSTVSAENIPKTYAIKAFLTVSKMDTVYAVWEYSSNGIVWNDVYEDSDSLTDVQFKDWYVDSSLTPPTENPEAASDVTYIIRQAQELKVVYNQEDDVFEDDASENKSSYTRADILMFPNSKVYADALKNVSDCIKYQYRLTLFSVNIKENVNYVKQIYAQKIFTFNSGPSTKFADTSLTNAVKGDKLYYRNRVYSYGNEGFQNNILVSDAGSFITPLFNVADVKVSENVYVNHLMPWRDYLIATTSQSIHLIKQVDEGSYIKTVSSNIGVPDKDRRTCATIYNGLIFKSGSKIYTLYPNTTSSDDTILNVSEISKPIPNILEKITYNIDAFAIGSSREYILFMPDSVANITHCIRYAYDTRAWTYYTYKNVVITDYFFKSADETHLFGYYNGVYTEYVFDKYLEDVYPDILATYGDYLDKDSLSLYTEQLEPKMPTPQPIPFSIDTGQKTDSVGIEKMFLETKCILATVNPNDRFSDLTAKVYIDGNNYPVTARKDASLMDTTSNSALVLGDTLDGSLNDTYNVLKQFYLRYAGRGKSIRYIISGTSSHDFKILGIHSRYRVMPNKM